MRACEAREDAVDLILGRAGDQQDELVAAEPGQQVARAQRCAPDGGGASASRPLLAAWPPASLTSLKSSRSMTASASGSPRRRAIARCRAAVEINPVRLSRPVRPSVCASARRRALSRVRTATATQTIVEMVSHTVTSVGERAAQAHPEDGDRQRGVQARCAGPEVERVDRRPREAERAQHQPSLGGRRGYTPRCGAR